MYKKTLILIITGVLLLSSGKIFNLMSKVTSYFHEHFLNYASIGYDIDVYGITISESNLKNFKYIYKFYPTNLSTKSPEFKEKFKVFCDTLKKYNRWSKGTLTFNDTLYNVKIKIHGASPHQHLDGSYFSLKIKLDGSQLIKGAKKFSLIGYSRINYKFDIINYLSRTLQIIYSESILSYGQINGGTNYLVFRESEIGQNNISNKDKNFIQLEAKNDNSLIYTHGTNLSKWNHRLKKTISKLNMNDSLKRIAFHDYSSLNSAIFNRDTAGILAKFDLEYLSRVMAYMTITGSTGHGVTIGNLQVIYNTKNNLFYPVIHRDFIFSTLHQDNYKEIGLMVNIDTNKYHSPLFEIFTSSKPINKMTNEYLQKYVVNSFSTDSIKNIIDNHNKYYYYDYFNSLLSSDEEHQLIQNYSLLYSYFYGKYN